VLLADDHTLLRDGLRRLLQDQEDLEVVGEAGDGHTALRLVRHLRPAVIVLALALSSLDGLEVTKRIVTERLTTAVLMVTMHATVDYAVRALRAGARGFLSKSASGNEVIAAIRKIAAGKVCLPSALSEVVPILYGPAEEKHTLLALLSDREVQVLKRIAEGRTNTYIASDLRMSLKTLEAYRARVMTKLAARSTADLIRFALRERVIADAW
jgi:DNA-binding NarL/FixJ family response regulator